MEDRGQIAENDNNDDEETKYSGVIREHVQFKKFKSFNTLKDTKPNKDTIKHFAAEFLRDVGKVTYAFTYSEEENNLNEAKIIQTNKSVEEIQHAISPPPAGIEPEAILEQSVPSITEHVILDINRPEF